MTNKEGTMETKNFRISKMEMQPIHPFRSGLPLNLLASVSDSELPQRKPALWKRAFDQSIAKLDPLSKQSNKNNIGITHLMRSNLTMDIRLWAKSEQGNKRILASFATFIWLILKFT